MIRMVIDMVVDPEDLIDRYNKKYKKELIIERLPKMFVFKISEVLMSKTEKTYECIALPQNEYLIRWPMDENSPQKSIDSKYHKEYYSPIQVEENIKRKIWIIKEVKIK